MAAFGGNRVKWSGFVWIDKKILVGLPSGEKIRVDVDLFLAGAPKIIVAVACSASYGSHASDEMLG